MSTSFSFPPPSSAFASMSSRSSSIPDEEFLLNWRLPSSIDSVIVESSMVGLSLAPCHRGSDLRRKKELIEPRR
ncbi:hypothetical protein PIB30_076781, partial [Stylosanthes scabra]|nr:hypothetical protein [Stylosanthes scabra]